MRSPMSVPHPVCPFCLVYHVKLLSLFNLLSNLPRKEYNDTFNCSSCKAVLNVYNNEGSVFIPSAFFYISNIIFSIDLIKKILTINSINANKNITTKTIHFASLKEVVDKINTYKLYV